MDKKLFTENEIKDMRDFMEKEYKPLIIERLKKKYSKEEIEEILTNDSECEEYCSHCQGAINVKMSYHNFKPIKCPTCGEFLVICSLCSGLIGIDSCSKKICPIQYIENKRTDKINSLNRQLTEIETKIKNFVPGIDDNKLHNMFADSIDEDYFNQHGTKEVEIGCATFWPSDVWEKLDITGFNVSKSNFAHNLSEIQKKEFDTYQELIEKKEEIEKLIEEKENGK